VKISAQISLYPLRQEKLAPAIETLRVALERGGLVPEVGAMSTVVSGEAERVFAALQEGFEEAAARGPVALVVTLSNACPADARVRG